MEGHAEGDWQYIDHTHSMLIVTMNLSSFTPLIRMSHYIFVTKTKGFAEQPLIFLKFDSTNKVNRTRINLSNLYSMEWQTNSLDLVRKTIAEVWQPFLQYCHWNLIVRNDDFLHSHLRQPSEENQWKKNQGKINITCAG